MDGSSLLVPRTNLLSSSATHPPVFKVTQITATVFRLQREGKAGNKKISEKLFAQDIHSICASSQSRWPKADYFRQFPQKETHISEVAWRRALRELGAEIGEFLLFSGYIPFLARNPALHVVDFAFDLVLFALKIFHYFQDV